MTCRAGLASCQSDAFLPFDAFLSLRTTYSVILMSSVIPKRSEESGAKALAEPRNCASDPSLRSG